MSNLFNAVKNMLVKLEENEKNQKPRREIIRPRDYNYLVAEGLIDSRFIIDEGVCTSEDILSVREEIQSLKKRNYILEKQRDIAVSYLESYTEEAFIKMQELEDTCLFPRTL